MDKRLRGFAKDDDTRDLSLTASGQRALHYWLAIFEMVAPGMAGVAEAEAARRLWGEEWAGPAFMGIGGKDADRATMAELRNQIRGCPEPLVFPEAGHFVPEWGEPVAQAALRAFGDSWRWPGNPHDKARRS